MRSVFTRILIIVWAMVLASSCAFAQGNDYPAKPIRLIVPWPAGGIADLRGRLIGDRLAKAMGQPVIVDNRPGADGTIGAYAAAQARPDGYTILLGSSIDQAIALAVHRDLPYEPLRDLVPIVMYGRSHLVLVANPGVPARDMKEFIAWLKGSRDPPAYASGGNAHPAHLAGVMLQDGLGANLLHVPYKGSAPALTAVMSGEVSFGFDFVGTSLSLIEAGKLRALVVMGPKRLRLLPNVPCIDEIGLANAYAYTWGGFFVPKGTPLAVATRLRVELEKIGNSSDIRDHIGFSGVEFEVRSGNDFIDFIRAEQVKWGYLVKAAGIRTD